MVWVGKLGIQPGLGRGSVNFGCVLADKDRDIATGTTSHGAQRADIRVFVDGVAAADSLSRGQSKLLVYAL